ncbi:MAG: hypothetical protein VB127_00860 [Sphaerochaeta sp.]|jgi:hypothetical protein|nr:hypothetical protein [Sphaerochaeta sp.]
MEERMQTREVLPQWYQKMLASPILLLLFVVAVFLASPLLLVYGALSPIFRR